MASARRRRAALVLRTLLVAVTCGAVLPLSSAVSAAAPAPSLSALRQQVAALGEQANVASERYDAAVERLQAAQRAQQAIQAHLATQRARVAALRTQLDAFAAAAYRSGGAGEELMALMATSQPQRFLDRASSLEVISHVQGLALGEFDTASHDLAEAQASAQRAARAEAAVVRSLSAQKAHITALLARQQALLNQRTAAAAQLTAELAAQAAQQRALRYSYAGPASGRAAAAVRFAYAQLGKPYQWGGAGPNSYDCSGLTMAAWAAAGVYLPHNAAQQQSDIPAVAPGDLQPGDLVFFGSPAYHVGIYVGNGDMIAAPHSGDVVRVQPLAYMPDYSGAGRP